MGESYKSIKKSIGEFLKDVKKNPVLAIVFLLIGIGVAFLYLYINNLFLPEKGQANIGQVFQSGPSASEEKSQLCEGGLFSEKLTDWKIKYYSKPDKEGFYCPSRFSSFSSPDIWYGKEISTNFKSLKIRFKLKNADNNEDIPASFIFSVGNNPRILRFYITEKDFQVIGFEKINIENPERKLIRGNVQTLTSPIDYETDIELKVRSVVSAKNKLTFYFNLMYVSDLTNEPVEDSFSYEVILPDPLPESELSNIKIGFGTFKKKCIKPISYNFCY